ncbi:unnamed protein product (macronuclear) [Paramecium tetraurelia]|uniref:Uncharacterized protein n=1 Tax=Paramecium tetraurelia TaxID=5888 RepID=A0CDI5_PARTE|nr:uncharacterized protein GSPATT00007063001 [Paramecium tetraurelia]CAK68852.1 unnamed protein product [Paramecium tetraurelia]|eukprot:XP_001436249.1 hypothetical protein (macronuclear) [Paramecium tetraurelia strain d4-2]
MGNSIIGESIVVLVTLLMISLLDIILNLQFLKVVQLHKLKLLHLLKKNNHIGEKKNKNLFLLHQMLFQMFSLRRRTTILARRRGREEQPYWGEEEQEFVPPPVSPPVIPDEIQPEPLPEPEPQPEPEAAPAPAPKPAPGPAPPSEPQVPVVKECEATIDVTKENAADILCAISEYLAQLASGHVPELGINPSRVCFCLQYDDSESNESFMQVEAILKENDAFTINKLVAQR